MKLSFYNILIFILFHLIFVSCLNDLVQPGRTEELEEGAKILSLIESRGDFINSESMPSLVTAEELMANINDYLIFDIRDSISFFDGHINGAVNIKVDSLINYYEQANGTAFRKVVIVSKTGEAASYFNACFRFLGYDNVYSLNFGMASWNEKFADIWIDSFGEVKSFWMFDNKLYPKKSFSELPKLNFENNTLTTGEKLRHRINILMSKGFEEKSVDNQYLSPGEKSIFISDESSPNISLPEVYSSFNRTDTIFTGLFIMCFGRSSIYYPLGYAGSIPDLPAHPPSTVWYRFPIIPETRSVDLFQTIPNNKVIAVYSSAGHASAFFTAYLRVLGYNAKSIAFGAHNFHYSALSFHEHLGILYFRESYIRNYPYVTGNR